MSQFNPKEYRTYMEVPAGMIDQSCVDASLESSLTSVRYSNDGLYGILKFRGPVPHPLAGILQYNLDDFVSEVLSLDRWQFNE